jgi:hypothetical protein
MVVSLAAVTALGCGGESLPHSPSNTPRDLLLSGRVTETTPTNSVGVAGASLTIVDGVNAGQSAESDGNGHYRLAGLQRGTFNVSVSAGGYATATFPISLSVSISRDFSLAPVGPRTTITPGRHRVNIDIAPGRYFANPPWECYWERQSGLGRTRDEVIASHWLINPASQLIVEILASDVGFESTETCGTWFNTPRWNAQINIPPGTWLVDAQVSPGRYRAANPDGWCHWQRLRDFEGLVSSVIASDRVDTRGQAVFVSINPDDAGFSSSSCGMWTPAP